jgi:RNA polymerase sigma-70 factor (ECF subfamily)
MSQKDSRVARAEERRLIAAARGGDRRALSALLERATAPAWRFSRGFCRDPHDTEDLVQEVLASLMRSLKSFRGESSISTWMYVVARRACGKLRQRRARQSAIDELPEEPRAAAALEPPRRLERRELARALERAVAALPLAQREVLVLRDVEGLPAADVARVLKLNVRAVKSRLHRARLALREHLAPYAPATARGEHCPETARLLSRHIEGELSAATCARLERHVDGCAPCTAECDSLKAVLGECRSYGEGALPAEVKRAVRAAAKRVIAAARPPRSTSSGRLTGRARKGRSARVMRLQRSPLLT